MPRLGGKRLPGARELLPSQTCWLRTLTPFRDQLPHSQIQLDHLNFSVEDQRGTCILKKKETDLNRQGYSHLIEVSSPHTAHLPFSSVAQSCLALWPHGLQHARPPCPSPTPRIYSDSCPLSRWCHPTISSSVIPFTSCLQSLPASGSFPMSQLFEWGAQSTGVSASASVLTMNTQDWYLLEWTGWISLQSKGLSRVFSNTTVQKHQFLSAQLSSQSNSHTHTWPLEKP